MKRQLFLVMLIIVVVPSISLMLVDLAVGDCGLFTFINQALVNSMLDFACAYASPIFFFVLFFFTLAKLFVSKKNTWIAVGVISLLTGLLSYIVGSLIKLLVARPRPFEVLSSVRIVGLLDTSSYSFPSITTMLVFGLSLPILILFEKRWYGAILSVLSYFIGFSVVYTGFHFPADVVAGTLFSLGIAICTSSIRGQAVNFLEKLKIHSRS